MPSLLHTERRLHVFDLDFNTILPKLNTAISTEWVWVFLELPAIIRLSIPEKSMADTLKLYNS